MSDFPTGFTDQAEPLTAGRFSGADAEMVNQLGEKGYEIHIGLTKAFAGEIIDMCLQPSIREFCPNDCGRRFKDMSATAAWLTKGRAAVLLLKQETGGLRLAGYGWAGRETDSHVPGGETTFAIRIGEADQGQGLATPYCRLIVAASSIIYGAQNYWLETWASDGAAVHIYHKIGFEDVAQEPGKRSTAAGATVADTRLFMSLPNALLPN